MCRQRSGVMALLAPELLEQPRASGLPIALGGRDRDAEDLAGLFESQTAEESELRQLTLARIECGEPGQRGIEVEHVDVYRRRRPVGVVERDARPSTRSLRHAARARAIDEKAPHHL